MNQQYNPHYDPLYDAIPGKATDYPPSYWVATAGKIPANDGVITTDLDVDVAIIGGGLTGLATAMFLAREHGIKATVIEANLPGWGCSCRNGGQGHLAWGRLSRSQWAKRWGPETAKAFHDCCLIGFDIFQTFAEDPDFACDPCGHGNILVAHSASAMARLQQESELCNKLLQYQTRIIDRATLHAQYLQDMEAYGALIEPVGIGVHPLKLAFGYLRHARALGARVYHGSPVLSWQSAQRGHRLRTPGGIVQARAVVVATAGYTNYRLHPSLAYRNMPILANSAVTAKLSEAQITDAGLKSHIFATDSRNLRYYYRFLPDKRLQIGTRSAITGADAENPKHLQIVQAAIAQKFPSLAGIDIEYFCSGWMDISHDMIPRIDQPDPQQTMFYAQGYSGNGVAFSAYAANRLAALVAGKPIKERSLPLFTSSLPRHPLRPLRRLGLRLLYKYYSLLDRLP